MTLPRGPRVRLRSCQVLGNEVQSLDCPRNGKRDKPLITATARVAREGELASLASPETGPEAFLTTFRRRGRRQGGSTCCVSSAVSSPPSLYPFVWRRTTSWSSPPRALRTR